MHSEFKKCRGSLLVMWCFFDLLGVPRDCAINVFSMSGLGLHEDHSDPIVAVATIVHVGSSREKPGRTGFAHFFEHMAFNNSENVPNQGDHGFL